MVYFDGEKVGGLNPRANHFYVSKIFAESRSMEGLLKEVGFEWVVKNQTHQYWVRRGPGSAAAFEAAVEATTGVPL